MEQTATPGGAELITVTWDPTSDSPCTAYACNGDGPNPWYNPNPITVSSYDTLEFDIKYDTTSDITLAQLNDVSTWPLTLTNAASANASVFQSWASAGQLAAGGSIVGLEITLCGGPAGQMGPTIAFTNIPAAAASGWVRVKIPINKAQAQIDGVSGIVFHKWTANTWTLVTPVSARFWIDNVMLIGTSTPPPPPTVKIPTKATSGLAVFNSTSGLYDRQAAVMRQSTGLSWVGQATTGNPVTYSFTIAGYPNSVNCEAWMFLFPNPDYLHSAPDWNGTNCVKIRLQGSATSGTMQFQYKVNEDHQQAMYYSGDEARGFYTNAPGSWDGVTPNYLESGLLGQVSGDSILGKWQVRFTSDTNITLIAPNGASTNLVMPSYNTGYFAEQGNPGFYIYLGMQANNADAQNQAIVFSDFAVSNSVTPFYENFLTDTVLDTTNVWNTSSSPGPQGVLLVPANASSWATWTLPDPGFNLQIGTNLTTPAAWADPTTGPRISMNGVRAQLLSSSEIPAGNAAFFRLIKRNFTKLQVLLPGETSAPNTVTGKTGTPTPTTAGAIVNVTINAVDDTFNVVNSTDTIHLVGSDPSVLPDGDYPLISGTVNIPVMFQNAGAFTVTASDLTNPAKTSDTSSSITVNP